MAKTSTSTKSKKTSQTSESTAQTLAAPETTVTSAPVETVTSTPAVTLAPTETTVAPTETEESNTEILFNKLLTQFQDVQSVMKVLSTNLKVLQKQYLKDQRESKKLSLKKQAKKANSGKKTTSGITSPTPITPDLAKFLGLDENQMIPRTKVTSMVIEYIKKNDLQNKENKKQIIPNVALESILQANGEVVTFFNLQTYLKKHFLKNTTETTSTAPATVV